MATSDDAFGLPGAPNYLDDVEEKEPIGFNGGKQRRPSLRSSDSGVVGDDASSKKPHTILSLIHNFGDTTSMHGVSRALGDKSIWRRLFWTTIVLGFACWAGYNVTAIVNDYLTHPVTSTVSSEYKPELPYPAVTICNLNRIRRSKATPQMLSDINSYLEWGLTIEETNLYLDSMFRQIDPELQIEMGHQIEHMLYSCHFGAEECSARNFTQSFSLRYGNCYTFAGINSDGRSKWTTVKAGPVNGLILDLDIQSREYMNLTEKSGIKVIIHEREEFPFPEDGGLTAGPGFFTNIALRKAEVNRLPHPYGTCINVTEDSEDINKNHFAEQGFGYTLNACQKSCFQEHIYKRCNCCDSSYPCIDSVLIKSTGIKPKGGYIEYCNVTDWDIDICVEEVTGDFTANRLGCTEYCPPACHESTFATSLSSGVYPAPRYSYSFIQNIKESNKVQNVTEWDRFFTDSFLRLEIYYDSLILEIIDTQPAYSWNKLLGDIGGQLGLLLGFSILTALEILELIVLDLGFGLGLGWLFRCGKPSSGKVTSSKA